jgi:mycothiol synthase
VPTVKRTPRTWVVYSTPDELDEALADVKEQGGGEVRWFVSDPAPADEDAAGRHGLHLERDLLQLRRPLPVEAPVPDVVSRAFVPGQDEAEWVEVNNRAFATHPEQGGWTVEQVLEREAEPWFDAEGFRLHHDDATGALAAFVWTKIHAEETPPSGEIYVIGVDPSFQSRGLGKTMTLVGLDWMHRERGITRGMLYVDAANEAAVAMYTKLGFAIDHLDRSFLGRV